MELETEAPPSVLKIASMFASLSSQHRRVEFAKGTNVTGGRRSIEGPADAAFRALNTNVTTTKSAVFYTDHHNNVNRTRSRSSDSRPVCLDLKVMDNRTKFDHAKALFESLERQSRQEQRQRPLHNSKKRMASPSPSRSSSAARTEHFQQVATAVSSEPTAITTSSGCTVIRAGPPALRTVTIAKRDQQISSPTAPNSTYSCVVASETATFTAMNASGCSTTTITSSTRLISNAVAAASPSSPVVINNAKMPAAVTTPPPVPPKPKLIDSPRTSSESSSAVTSPSQVVGKTIFQRSWTLDNSAPAKNGVAEKDGASMAEEREIRVSVEKIAEPTATVKTEPVKPAGPIRNYYTRITQQRRNEMENSSNASTWNSSNNAGTSNAQKKPDADAKLEAKTPPASTAISVNTTLPSQPSSIVSPQKPSSLYEPYWRAHRYGRQRLANGDASAHEGSISPPAPADSAPTQVTAKRNFMLRVGSLDNSEALAQSKNDPGRLDVHWPPHNASGNATLKSPTEDNKDSGLGTDSPSTSTTDSRASSSMNAVPPPASLSNSTSTSADWAKVETDKIEDHSNVAFMTKEEASVLLSPSTRDVVLRDTRGRIGDDGEIRSLPSHLSIPQDVDLKRLSMCSMDSSSEHGGMATDRYSIPEDMNVNLLADGHFWIEVAGLEEEPPPSPNEAVFYKKPSRVRFATAPIKVYSTYTGQEYDRRNDEVDPVSASAEYELERRLEKMDMFEIELQKGPEGLGFSIIGMGVGADAGLEKLGIFVKSITPGGAVHRDGRICVCDQIVEVDGKSLVGVSQNYAASVLRSTSGTVRFKIGREKDLDNSEIAALIRQSLEQDRLLREQEEMFQRRLNGMTNGNLENGTSMEMQENSQYHRHDFLLAQNSWNNHRPSHESPLPSTDSVFARDDDETPEQLVDNPQIDRLMNQLREPPTVLAPVQEKSKSESSSSGSTASDVFEMQKPVGEPTKEDGQVSQTAFRSDGTQSNATNNVQPTYTAAEDISRLLNDSAHSEDMETRFPSNGAEPETIYNTTIQPSFITCQTQKTPEFGQLRRTTPDLTSSTDSMNGSEIQIRINHLEAELGDVRRETDKYQTLLNDSKNQYDNLEKKYGRAKKLIKDYQDREKDMLDRENEHLRQLREKDQQYANLVSLLKEKIVELEKQLQEAHRKRASIVESSAAASLSSTANLQNSSAPAGQPTSDISPALAYQPAKKLESTTSVDSATSATTSAYLKVPTGPVVRNIPIIRQPSLSSEVDGTKQEKRVHGPDFGVPETELLDSTAAKCKAEVVKQSQIMAARALPTRRRETEVFIMCHHTLENAHSLRAHASSGHCGAGICHNASVSPCSGSAECSVSAAVKSSSPSKSSSSGTTGSPSTPRRLTARAALLLRKKAAVNNAASSATSTSSNLQTRHLEASTTTVVVGGGDYEKLPAVLTWTCDDVCRFLRSIGLEKYTPEFSINRIDGCKLLQLDGSRLKAMGVQNHSDRALIKKQIKEMKAQIERERKQLEKESRRLLKLEKEKRHQLARP